MPGIADHTRMEEINVSQSASSKEASSSYISAHSWLAGALFILDHDLIDSAASYDLRPLVDFRLGRQQKLCRIYYHHCKRRSVGRSVSVSLQIEKS